MHRLLLLLVALCGCVAARVEKPYLKETTTTKDGTVTVREISADWIQGAGLDAISKPKPHQP